MLDRIQPALAKKAAAAVPSLVLPNPDLPLQGGVRENPFQPFAELDGRLSRAVSVAWLFHGRALRQLFCLVVRWRPP